MRLCDPTTVHGSDYCCSDVIQLIYYTQGHGKTSGRGLNLTNHPRVCGGRRKGTEAVPPLPAGWMRSVDQTSISMKLSTFTQSIQSVARSLALHPFEMDQSSFRGIHRELFFSEGSTGNAAYCSSSERCHKMANSLALVIYCV